MSDLRADQLARRLGLGMKDTSMPMVRSGWPLNRRNYRLGLNELLGPGVLMPYPAILVHPHDKLRIKHARLVVCPEDDPATLLWMFEIFMPIDLRKVTVADRKSTRLNS